VHQTRERRSGRPSGDLIILFVTDIDFSLKNNVRS
jgi:hypothetical protein